MGPSRSLAFYIILIIFSLSTIAIRAEESSTPDVYRIQKADILYRARTGDATLAIKKYFNYRNQLGEEDIELIQQMGQLFIEMGYRSNNPEEQLLSVYGAGIASTSKLIFMLEEGLKQSNPLVQLACIRFLDEMQDDRANEALKQALSSEFLIIRLEALLCLAKHQDPIVPGHIEALLYKVDPSLRAVFPPFFALFGDSFSCSKLKQLLVDPDFRVRLAVISSAAQYDREELLPDFQALATHPDVVQQEACATVLGQFKDERSAPILENLTKSGFPNVQLAAWGALYNLGRAQAKQKIEALALKGDLFATALLGEISDTEETLLCLLKRQERSLRLNAALSLLKKRDPRCLTEIKTIFQCHERGLSLVSQSSPGGSLHCWKLSPLSGKSSLEEETLEEERLLLLEALLAQLRHLPADKFLAFVDELVVSHHKELIPAAISLVEELDRPTAVNFLKKQLSKASSTLVRTYCSLALYRLEESGPYSNLIYSWLSNEWHGELIHFRPITTRNSKEFATKHLMTPKQSSRLFIECLTALTNHKDPQAIQILLMTIAYGNPKNRPALGGLLLRATE